MLVYNFIRNEGNYYDTSEISKVLIIQNQLRLSNDAFKPLEEIKKWEDYFRIDYFSYRRKLFEIAQMHHSSSYFDVTINYCNEQLINELNGLNIRQFILPIDDDDWLDHEIVDIIKETSDEKKVVIFGTQGFYSEFFESKKMTLETLSGLKILKEVLIVFSNCCAFETPIPYEILKYHGKASKRIREMPEGKIEIIDKILGFKLNHPGSLFLLRGYGIEYLVQKTKILLKNNKEVENKIQPNFLLQWKCYCDLLSDIMK